MTYFLGYTQVSKYYKIIYNISVIINSINGNDPMKNAFNFNKPKQ